MRGGAPIGPRCVDLAPAAAWRSSDTLVAAGRNRTSRRRSPSRCGQPRSIAMNVLAQMPFAQRRSPSPAMAATKSRPTLRRRSPRGHGAVSCGSTTCPAMTGRPKNSSGGSLSTVITWWPRTCIHARPRAPLPMTRRRRRGPQAGCPMIAWSATSPARSIPRLVARRQREVRCHRALFGRPARVPGRLLAAVRRGGGLLRRIHRRGSARRVPRAMQADPGPGAEPELPAAGPVRGRRPVPGAARRWRRWTPS